MDQALDELVRLYIGSLGILRSQRRLEQSALGNALSALVDLCITGIYTNGLINDRAEFVQEALICRDGHAIFPYTWMCPVCVAAGRSRPDCYLPGARREKKNGKIRDFPNVDRLAKPGGRAIGDQGIQAIKSLLRAVLKVSDPTARLRDGGGARGEFDLTVATHEVLAFIEVKAKPLVSYPLVVDISDSDNREKHHRWQNISAGAAKSFSLFLGAIKEFLNLSRPTIDNVDSWPLPDLARLAGNPDTVACIIDNWSQHASAYATWKDEPDRLRWHRFGCGNFNTDDIDGTRVEKRVANTKELPGLDRTDDIKKGAAQVLRYSRLKFLCEKRSLHSVLMGNTDALTHHDDYVSPLLHLKVIDSQGAPERTEWIFDAMIGLTHNHFNASKLGEIFAFERLLTALTPPTNDLTEALAHAQDASLP
ncbi:hypothetical protein [Paraburkholderia ribeironis]|nr:hypothetical protein [Paraburkholderia ribeironis]